MDGWKRRIAEMEYSETSRLVMDSSVDHYGGHSAMQ